MIFGNSNFGMSNRPLIFRSYNEHRILPHNIQKTKQAQPQRSRLFLYALLSFLQTSSKHVFYGLQTRLRKRAK